MFVLLATFWGGSFVAIEIGLHYFPPLVFAGLRYAVAGAVILGYAAVATDRWRPRERGEYLAVAVVGVFVIAGYHGLLYLGEQRISGAIAAVVVSLSPVLTAGFAAVLLDERLTIPKGVGFALGITGVAIVAGLNPANALSTSVFGVGLVLVGIACFALGAVLTRPLRTDLPVATMEGWAMLGGSGLLFAAGALRGESLAAVRLTPTSLASFAYLTLLSGVVAYLLYFHLLDEIGPTRLNLVGYLEPVVATLASWAVLGELVGPTTFVGFAAIFAGFAVLNRHVVRRAAVSVRRSLARGEQSDASPDADGERGNAWSSPTGPADD
ncbi:EamA family transporter [Halorussus limi]|uniref:EamA family transporter n=1 Tax=Halorussus limi TaxID=2938695 RepID=A0A8U0HT28_9EURY|nr:EamA family transporter [Halorussus limi]UPV73961.1 EamA family transporter [Halorussus limi]